MQLNEESGYLNNVEVQHILFKGNANRIQNQVYLNYVEVQHILFKGNANRIQNQVYLNYVEVPLILFRRYILNNIYNYGRSL